MNSPIATELARKMTEDPTTFFRTSLISHLRDTPLTDPEEILEELLSVTPTDSAAFDELLNCNFFCNCGTVETTAIEDLEDLAGPLRKKTERSFK